VIRFPMADSSRPRPQARACSPTGSIRLFLFHTERDATPPPALDAFPPCLARFVPHRWRTMYALAGSVSPRGSPNGCSPLHAGRAPGEARRLDPPPAYQRRPLPRHPGAPGSGTGARRGPRHRRLVTRQTFAHRRGRARR
jgi:hypothetical protein